MTGNSFGRRRASVAVVIIGLFVAPSVVEATVYINQNAESLTCGANIPESVFWPGGDGNPMAATGHVNCGGAPQGNKYFEWTTVAGQGTAGNSTPDVNGTCSDTPNARALGLTNENACLNSYE